MQSQRKKLGNFNHFPSSNIKQPHEQKTFKSERKIDPQQQIYGNSYCPEIDTDPYLEKIARTNPTGIQFHEVFFLTSDNSYNNEDQSDETQQLNGNMLSMNMNSFEKSEEYQIRFPERQMFLNEFMLDGILEEEDSQHLNEEERQF